MSYKVINMPSASLEMKKGAITKWFVKPGDFVNKGDIYKDIFKCF